MKVSATVGTFMALYHTCEAPQALRSQEKMEAAINGETPLDTPLLGEVQRNRVYKIVKWFTQYIHEKLARYMQSTGPKAACKRKHSAVGLFAV
jgi:hypothetical protein